MKERFVWINRVKLLACILVVLGHFLSGLVISDIIKDNIFLEWFSKTIYYFHVPLFFICSGYLYQNSSKVTNFKEWKDNIIKKFLALGMPYVLFSIITVVMKIIASDSVNNKAPSLVYTIFLDPIAPYWFLYILFFMFAFTKTYQNKKDVLMISLVALVAKVLIMTIQHINDIYNNIPYFIRGLAINEIWFVIGMNCRYFWKPKELIDKCKNIRKFIYIFTLAIVISISIMIFKIDLEIVYFINGLLFCYSIIGMVIYLSKYNMGTIEKYISPYTMSIFLMHTIYAAGIRIVLIKIGVFNPIIHIGVGFISSIYLPILTEKVMKKNKLLYFWIYPNKVLKERRKKWIKEV